MHGETMAAESSRAMMADKEGTVAMATVMATDTVTEAVTDTDTEMKTATVTVVNKHDKIN